MKLIMINTIKNKSKKFIVKIVNRKNIRKIICVMLLICVFITWTDIYGASDPKLVSSLNNAFKKIQGYLVKLSVPAAGVAIATGVMIRKLSFGNEEKMAIGKKVIINAVVCYGIILSIDLIIKFIESVLR